MRDHDTVVTEEFNGWWSRGGEDSVPPDHFVDCENVQFRQSSFKTRDGLDLYLAVSRPVRMYTFTQQQKQSLIILDDAGNFYDSGGLAPTTPILSIPGAQDFGMASINGRAFITPAKIHTDAFGNKFILGMTGQFVYVYDPTTGIARKAAGNPPVGTLTLASGAAGSVEAGFHNFAVAYETNTGYITQIAGFAAINAPGSTKIDVSNIPVSPDSFVVARRLVATVAIDPTEYTGDLQGYQFFFIPGGRIADNTSTTATVDFFDADLLEDASHLLDLLSEIPAQAGLNTYHNRMIGWASATDISLMRVSYPGEPEAMDAVSGLLIAPLDGTPLTNGQEFRDVLYGFKKVRTYAWSDNGDVPTSWPLITIDEGIGASNHGIATVLDSGGVNIDFLIIVDYSGMMLFNGTYTRPELSWKIRDFWIGLDRNNFLNIQILNDTIKQLIVMTLPYLQLLVGDYSNGLNPKDIRWTKWIFNVETTTIALIETNKIVIGSHALYTP